MQQRYSLGAIILHWLLALALAFQLSLGLGLEYLGRNGFAQYQLHKSVGIAILALSLLRLVWRLTHKSPPALEGGLGGWFAKAVHFGLYLFMIGAPLTGWLLVSTDRVTVPTMLFGALHWPHLPAPHGLNGFAHVSHSLLGFLGIGLIVLHVAGALRHQWLIRDNLMARMAPARGLWLALALLVPIGWALGVMTIKGAGKHAGQGAEPALAQAPAPTDTDDAAPNAVAVPDHAAANSAAAVATPAPPPSWAIQPGGTLAFSVTNGADRITGRFAKWSGNIVFDPEQPENPRISLTVDLRTASVGDGTQDAMLAGADFLDTATHPRAVYRVTSVRRIAADRYAAKGTLTLKGKSEPQDIVFALTGTGLSRHVEGSAVINRARFGIGEGEVAQNLAPNVQLTFGFDAIGTSEK